MQPHFYFDRALTFGTMFRFSLNIWKHGYCVDLAKLKAPIFNG